jgi:hypothetical protein
MRESNGPSSVGRFPLPNKTKGRKLLVKECFVWLERNANEREKVVGKTYKSQDGQCKEPSWDRSRESLTCQVNHSDFCQVGNALGDGTDQKLCGVEQRLFEASGTNQKTKKKKKETRKKTEGKSKYNKTR